MIKKYWKILNYSILGIEYVLVRLRYAGIIERRHQTLNHLIDGFNCHYAYELQVH